MKKLTIIALALATTTLTSCKEKETKTEEVKVTETVTPEVPVTEVESFKITPISHASTILEWDNTVLYMDPVGGADSYPEDKAPNVILITDIHGDHLNVETLEGLLSNDPTFIVPQAVADKMPENLKKNLVILNNDETKEILGFAITGVPMYNIRKEDLNKHVKGRGNGYIIEKDSKRVYFSGDTEDIPEMRALKDIDIAFVCMNLPYTMTVENAASAVLDFKPTQVYPYHYRGKDGLSDVVAFKELVNAGNNDIEVIQLEWYPTL